MQHILSTESIARRFTIANRNRLLLSKPRSAHSRRGTKATIGILSSTTIPFKYEFLNQSFLVVEQGDKLIAKNTTLIDFPPWNYKKHMRRK